MSFQAIDYVKIESGRITVYTQLEGYVPIKNKTSFKTEGNTKGKVKGKLSKGATKRIKKIVFVWLSTVQFYLLSKGYSLKETRKHIKFITLTLPSKQMHTDKEIKRNMLNNFIIQMKAKYGMRNYLWIAETQGNGNLHFHIITNTNIHHATIKKTWNKILNHYGYIDKFEEKHGHREPNSTDIHILKKVRNLSAYLTKEMTKGQHSRPIEGKLWGCSKNLLKLEPYETVYTPELNNVVWEMDNRQELDIFRDKFFAVMFYKSIDIFEKMKFNEVPEIYEHYQKQMELLFYKK